MMESRKIVVPLEMLEVAENSGAGCGSTSCELILEAALRWLSKNPIVPSDEQGLDLEAQWRRTKPDKTCVAWCSAEWQRRMFLADEPTQQEKIEAILTKHFKHIGVVDCAAEIVELLEKK